jgi:hypothetical protein
MGKLTGMLRGFEMGNLTGKVKGILSLRVNSSGSGYSKAILKATYCSKGSSSGCLMGLSRESLRAILKKTARVRVMELTRHRLMDSLTGSG